MRKIFIILLFCCCGCLTNAQMPNYNFNEIIKSAIEYIKSMDSLKTINDTFFYKADGSFLQYPRTITIGNNTISNCWFESDTMITYKENNKTKVVVMPPRSSFKYVSVYEKE